MPEEILTFTKHLSLASTFQEHLNSLGVCMSSYLRRTCFKEVVLARPSCLMCGQAVSGLLLLPPLWTALTLQRSGLVVGGRRIGRVMITLQEGVNGLA